MTTTRTPAPFTQINTLDDRQQPCSNEGVILLTDDAVATDEMTDGGTNDKSTCKRSQLQPSRLVSLSQQETERRRDQ